MRIAEKISKALYTSPTQEQVDKVHHEVRKAAHVILFFVFGILVSLTGTYIFGLCSKPWTAALVLAAGFVLIVGAGWLDEWHKQFIEGRHYQFGEAVINIVSGLAGRAVVVIIRNFFTGL